jgi:hypothetical protein
MNLFNWNLEQINEAKSSVNRYFFWLKYQREPLDDNELVLFYIEQGGAKHFRKQKEVLDVKKET